MNTLQLSDYWLHFTARRLCHTQHPKSRSFLILSSRCLWCVCSWDFYLPGSLQHYANKLAGSALGIWGSLHLHLGGFACVGVRFPALYSETCVFPKVRNHTSVTSRIVREGFLALTSSKDTKGDTQVCGLTSHCQQPQALGLEMTVAVFS